MSCDAIEIISVRYTLPIRIYVGTGLNVGNYRRMIIGCVYAPILVVTRICVIIRPHAFFAVDNVAVSFAVSVNCSILNNKQK